MLKILFLSILSIQLSFQSDASDLSQDYLQGTFKDEPLRKAEDWTFSSMMVMNGDQTSKYKSYSSNWIDEPARFLPKYAKEQPRKIISEFYPTNQSARWPDNLVPYQISPELMNNAFINMSIHNAIEHWQRLTCIKFEEYQPSKHSRTHEAVVEFVKTNMGCYSEIGYPNFFMRIPNFLVKRRIFLEQNCLRGQIIHEIGHTIGFFHEHSRNDRDNYVDIKWENIAFPFFNRLNFEKAGEALEKDYLNVPYDLGSVMHYPANAFSMSFLKTIEPKDKNLEFLLGNREGLSFYDAKMANLAYKCSNKCKNQLNNCQNDGYIGPDCKCVCPEGLTGETCEILISKNEKSVPLSHLNLTCDFTEGLCSWSQEKFRDQIDFILNRGRSFAAEYLNSVGILDDHTFNQSGYLYVDTYFVKYRFESAELKSPLVKVKSKTNFCISFWYHMFGNDLVLPGELSVYLHQPFFSQNLTKIWSRAGRQDQNQSDWLYAQLDLEVMSEFRIVFKAQRFSGFLGDIGLDDIQFDEGFCSEPDTAPTEWTPWYILSGCFLECGTEYYERQRYCQIGIGEKSCNGPETDFQLCPNPECQNLTDFNSTENFTISFFQEPTLNLSIDIKNPLPNVEPVELNSALKTVRQCGQTVYLEVNETIQLASPGYPQEYPLETECSYLIRTENGSKIHLSFEYINIESTAINTCPDSVEIRYYALGQPGLRLCGNYSKNRSKKILEFTSENNEALVIFRSDWIKSANGFLLKILSQN
ncbi:blastula protease 10-like [Brachionus plicatilis]|uniref:Metalloendopeptidase n=1 Tax=Brachionus plicatilis TaxID=10195 RepID=A0A3M7SUE5_BRAPC|nr:blastula protease 10-like [Brachionus plicatilis]